MPKFEEGHKYKKVHGHSYEVTIRVIGEIKKEHGWVVDLEELDLFVKPLLKILDHTMLNEVAGLEEPTSENLAKWFWKKLEKKIKNLSSIEINRPRVGGCIYSGE